MTLPFTGFVVPSGGSSSGGAGDVTGPGSSTDNAIARFDGTGGKTLQDSGILVTDAAQLSWEGATADDFETTLGVTDPTADRTLLLPDSSGTLPAGPTTTTDTGLVRWSGAAGGLVLNSGVLVDGSNVMSGVTQLNVDNIRIDGNTISVTDSGGSLSLTANGSTGQIFVTDNGAAALPAIAGSGAFGNMGITPGTNGLEIFSGGAVRARARNASFDLAVDLYFGTSSNRTFSNLDVGLSRNAAGVLRVTNASTGLGRFLSGVLVEANTAGSGAPNVIVANESRTVFTNEGTTAANYHTLPTAVAGYVYEFIVQDADGIRIVANTDDTIRVIDKVTAAAGYIESTTIGSAVRLVSINAVEWFATSIHGVWTDGTFTFDDTGSTSP